MSKKMLCGMHLYRSGMDDNGELKGTITLSASSGKVELRLDEEICEKIALIVIDGATSQLMDIADALRKELEKKKDES